MLIDICMTVHRARSGRIHKLKTVVPFEEDTEVGGTFTFYSSHFCIIQLFYPKKVLPVPLKCKEYL